MAVVYTEIDVTLASVAGPQDIWSLFLPTGNKLRLLGWELSSSELAAVLLDINLHFITAAGTGGATATEVNADNGDDRTLTGSVRTEDTTPGTASGPMMSYQWEQLGPVGHIFTPMMAPEMKVGTGVAVTLNTISVTPTLSGWICHEEI